MDIVYTNILNIWYVTLYNVLERKLSSNLYVLCGMAVLRKIVRFEILFLSIEFCANIGVVICKYVL